MKTWTTKTGQTIHRILDGRCNCYLISRNSKYLLIDCGQKNNLKKLFQRFEDLKVDSTSLAALIFTHSHFDHAENAASIKEKYHTPIIIQKNEADNLKTGDGPIIQGTNTFFKIMTDLFVRKPMLRLVHYKPVDPDVLVDDTYDLAEFGFNGYLIYTPGHTPGSMCVVLDNEIAIVGDTMFGIFKGSIYPPFAENKTNLIHSWKKLMETGCSTFLPAHGTERSKEVVQQQYDKYYGL